MRVSRWDEIVEKYNDHMKSRFPDRRGDHVAGIDLVLIDSDIAGLITKYIGNGGSLSDVDLTILRKCHADLAIVIKELKGDDREYFTQLLNIAKLICFPEMSG